MNKNWLLFWLGMVLVTSCTDVTTTRTDGTAAAPTPTPENYGLYTDSDLQIYADTIDFRIKEALKNNNTSQAQELGRKRQELIAEFNRRGLKRGAAAATPARHPRQVYPVKHQRQGTGLPGDD